MAEEITLLPDDIFNDFVKKEEFYHVFDDKEVINAINAALVIKRPLLIKGEPGIGKSQLAKAVAVKLGYEFMPFVVDASTESQDLLWDFDAVARLAEAQVMSGRKKPKDIHKALAVDNFVQPGVLWWALNWETADNLFKIKDYNNNNEKKNSKEDKKKKKRGVVVLIDEIDKASSTVPNGLLEVLEEKQFHPQGSKDLIEWDSDNQLYPLIIITTNEESKLSPAFIRRCLILHLQFPKGKDAQVNYLLKRAKGKFSEFSKFLDEKIDSQRKFDENNKKPIKVSLLEHAAELLVDDREYAFENDLSPLCGQSEYFDLLRGIKVLSEQGRGKPEDLLETVRRFTYQKLKVEK